METVVTRHETALVVAGARAQVAHGAATNPRGALAGRIREADHAGDRRGPVLAGRLFASVPGAAALPGRPRPGLPARREGTRRGAPFLHRDPGVVERHHGAVELFSREGPRSARLGARGLAAHLSREAERNAAALVVDGRTDGGADPDRVRGDLPGRATVRPLRRAHDLSDAG